VRAADVFPNVAALYGGGARPSSGSCCVGGCLEHFLVGEEHNPAVGLAAQAPIAAWIASWSLVFPSPLA
jgi:hypothetical protein